MSCAIVFALAVEERLPPVVGAASYGVLSRQLPRLVVAQLNGSSDRGVRFFPLLGPMEGRRQFFSIPDMLPPESLKEIHGQTGDVQFLVDGKIHKDTVSLRIHEVSTLRPVFEETLVFDPLDPMDVVRRLVFELSGLLGWTGRLPPGIQIEQPALSYFLVARDDLLSLEAGFERDGEGHWLKAISSVFEKRPDHLESRDLLLEICRRLLAMGEGSDEVSDLLIRAAATVGEAVNADDQKAANTAAQDFLGEAAVLLESAGRRKEAAALFDSLVGCTPTSDVVAIRVAGYLFRSGRQDEGREFLERCVAVGMSNPQVLAQLTVLCQQTGHHERRRELMDQLATRANLSPASSRMVCTYLVDEERADEALALLEDCLQRYPKDPALWLEMARVQLHRSAREASAEALDKALEFDPSPAIREDIRRLRRFIDSPKVLPELQALDEALERNDTKTALSLAMQVTRDHVDLAEGWLFLGVVRQRLEQPRRAIRALRQAIDADGELGEAHNRLGILLVGQSEYQEGHDHLQRAITLMPTESGPQIHMAQACFYLGRLDEGREALTEAERLGGGAEMVESVRRAFFAENG